MIDAHHHLWHYDAREYPWIPPGSALATDHLLAELDAVTRDAEVAGTVVVQARQTVDETTFLLDLAARCPRILGVVGWAPLCDAAIADRIDELAADPRLKGLRHVLQDEADEFFDRDDFHRGLSLLPSAGLTYDLLVFQRQLPAALRLVDRQPDLGIIIDHIAKPEARNGRVDGAWRRGMRELARRDQVLGVKFSGLLTEFPPGEGDAATVRAYFEETLEIFGSHRVMVGSDWPVCLLRTSYTDWVSTLRTLTAPLAPLDREALLGGNAARVYRL
jgi:L-fuconolactonase